MKNKLFYILLVVVFVAGLSLLLYPTISNAYNSWLQSKAIVEYSQQIDYLAQETAKVEWEKAQKYNQELSLRVSPFALTDEQKAQYPELLNVTSQGIMAYVQIPAIDVSLPIAHGTDDETLKDKIGHIEWSSLPVGGENTHCVISGHRGLPSSELFTNIDHLELGDKFYIHTLGKTLEYQVCNIAVVEPEDQSLLQPEQGQDLVTLVTCTPYGINSHRLLVRGIRTGADSGGAATQLQIKNEVTQIDVVVLVAVSLVVVAIAAFVILLLSRKKRGGGQRNEKTDNH